MILLVTMETGLETSHLKFLSAETDQLSLLFLRMLNSLNDTPSGCNVRWECFHLVPLSYSNTEVLSATQAGVALMSYSSVPHSDGRGRCNVNINGFVLFLSSTRSSGPLTKPNNVQQGIQTGQMGISSCWIQRAPVGPMCLSSSQEHIC